MTLNYVLEDHPGHSHEETFHLKIEASATFTYYHHQWCWSATKVQFGTNNKRLCLPVSLIM